MSACWSSVGQRVLRAESDAVQLRAGVSDPSQRPARWPEVNRMTPEKLFIGDKLAKATRDVELTYAVFSRGMYG